MTEIKQSYAKFSLLMHMIIMFLYLMYSAALRPIFYKIKLWIPVPANIMHRRRALHIISAITHTSIFPFHKDEQAWRLQYAMQMPTIRTSYSRDWAKHQNRNTKQGKNIPQLKISLPYSTELPHRAPVFFFFFFFFFFSKLLENCNKMCIHLQLVKQDQPMTYLMVLTRCFVSFFWFSF